MNLKLISITIFLGLALCFSSNVHAQEIEGIKAKVIDGDTIPIFQLDSVEVSNRKLTDADKKYWWNLRLNVRKVYPYAILAGKVIAEIDRETAGMSSKERKRYLKQKEKELSKKYKNELKNLSITQGNILVKLINRNTGRDAYSLIKELKGGLTARISQTGAFLYDNDLHATYDPHGRDKDIETVVQEIEAQGHFK